MSRPTQHVNFRLRKVFGLLLVALPGVLTVFVDRAQAQVTIQRLINSTKEPQNWLMYSGDYAGRRFSALDQITTTNASGLVPKWAYQTMAGGESEKRQRGRGGAVV